MLGIVSYEIVNIIKIYKNTYKRYLVVFVTDKYFLRSTIYFLSYRRTYIL